MVADTLGMKDLRQWLCWRFEERDGKPTKVPYDPSTGEKAESTNPKTWTSYEKAVSECKKHGYDGLGFVFTPEDDLCGVDLDKCLDPETGELEGWAQKIIGELDSYTEISPSGTGVHILVRGVLPAGRNRKGRFEAYDRGRYFTVTGKHLPGSPQTIESRQEALQSIVKRMFAEQSTNGHAKPVAPTELVDNGLSDSKVIQKALAASNGERFSRLWNGDTQEYGSHSEADLALCGMLAFWTGGDATRMDTLFRQSALYREKWDRNDYRNKTIAEALNGKTEFYEAPRRVKLADGTERKVEEKEERRNQADRLIGYALEDVQELFVDQHGAPHALIDGEPVPLTSRCYSWLRRLMWEAEGRSVSGEYLKMAAGTLSAHAEFSEEVRERFEVREPSEKDRRVFREVPTASVYSNDAPRTKLVVEHPIVPGCAGVEVPDYPRELRVCSQRAGRRLQVLAVDCPRLLLPHETPEPRAAARVERDGLTGNEGVRSAMLVGEEALDVI